MLNPIDIYLFFDAEQKKEIRPDYKKLLSSHLSDILPSGSGIDEDWSIEIFPDRIDCYNSYHRMKYGMYDGWMNFKVTLTPNNNDQFDIEVTGDELDMNLLGDRETLEWILDDIYQSVQICLGEHYEN